MLVESEVFCSGLTQSFKRSVQLQIGKEQQAPHQYPSSHSSETRARNRQHYLPLQSYLHDSLSKAINDLAQPSCKTKRATPKPPSYILPLLYKTSRSPIGIPLLLHSAIAEVFIPKATAKWDSSPVRFEMGFLHSHRLVRIAAGYPLQCHSSLNARL